MPHNVEPGGLVYTLRNEGSLAVLKEPLGFFCATRGSFESGRVLWCTRQAWRVLWRHHVIEGSLNVIPWLVYASHPMSE